MKKSFLCNNIGYILLVSLVIFPYLISIVFLLKLQYLNALYLSLVPTFIAIVLLAMRKDFFAKIEINNQGIKKYYGRKTLIFIKWEDMKRIKAVPKKNIIITKTQIYSTGKDFYKNLNENISFYANKNNCKTLMLYKERFNIPIENTIILNDNLKNILNK